MKTTFMASNRQYTATNRRATTITSRNGPNCAGVMPAAWPIRNQSGTLT